MGVTERKGDKIPSRLLTVSTELDLGLKPTNLEIMALMEIRSQKLNRLSHLGAPRVLFYVSNLYLLISKSVIFMFKIFKEIHYLERIRPR